MYNKLLMINLNTIYLSLSLILLFLANRFKIVHTRYIDNLIKELTFNLI